MAGPSPLIDVSYFKLEILSVLEREEDIDMELLSFDCDISVDEVRVVSASDRDAARDGASADPQASKFIEGEPALFDNEISASLSTTYDGTPVQTRQMSTNFPGYYNPNANNPNNNNSNHTNTTNNNNANNNNFVNTNNHANNNNGTMTYRFRATPPNNTITNTFNSNSNSSSTTTTTTTTTTTMTTTTTTTSHSNNSNNSNSLTTTSTGNHNNENHQEQEMITPAKHRVKRKRKENAEQQLAENGNPQSQVSPSQNGQHNSSQANPIDLSTDGLDLDGPPLSSSQQVLNLVKPDEVVLSFAVYHPRKNLKVQEYQVLGSQPLTALRDKIYCLCDRMFRKPSGYFFLEHVFFNDMRDPEAKDYSTSVIEWGGNNPRFLQPEAGPLVSARMEDTTFEMLRLRVNTPYLYCHQGDCQHIVTVTEVRLINKTDNQNASAYPIQTYLSKLRRRKCRVCDIYPARMLTVDDTLAAENPSYFCEACYHSLHYDEQNQLINGDYRVFPYQHE